MEFTIETSNAILSTATEMIEAGLDKEYAIEELMSMYSWTELSRDWFVAVIEGAKTIAEIKNISKNATAKNL